VNYGYDIECYPNIFTFSSKHVENDDRWYYEVSERRNDFHGLMTFLHALGGSSASMVGFNNLHYDYPMIHHMIQCAPAWSNLNAQALNAYIYEKNQSIFASNDRFGHVIWKPWIRQIDLFKIHHFDNVAKSTSLKVLEFNMRSINVSDLPFEPGHILTVDEMPVLGHYNMHDVDETVKFFHHTKPMIDFRDQLSAKYGKDFTNHNDTKIGKDYFIMRLDENAPGTCFYYDQNNKRQPRQTSRANGVPLADVIFPYVQFRNYEFNRILEWMKTQTLTSKDLKDTDTKGVNTKGVFKGVHCVVNGFKYDFGTGGIHGSLTGAAVVADDDYAIIDLDVASYYPNIAIVNRLFPEHLGETFCTIYKDVYEQRKTYAKKTVENGMLKLALNGVYGDSNNPYSPFFDPKYTMAITMNGQLLLCMLAESLLDIPGLSLIQINTDGLTVKVPRGAVSAVDICARHWETITGLELEDVNYQAMYIRDVNNYIGVYEDGKTKTKGAYESKQPQDRAPLGWHQNMSALVVPKAAEAALVHGVSIEEFIRSPDRDIMDFMCRTKTPRSSQLVLVDDNGVEHTQQRVTRYYVSHRGGSLFKISPPTKPHTVGWLKKGKGVSDAQYFAWHQANGDAWSPDIHQKNQGRYVTRRMGEVVGWKVEPCNDIRYVNGSNINHDYYISEAHKLVDSIRKV